MSRYKDKTKVQCSVCGKLIYPQGMKKHLEWAHNAPSVVSGKGRRPVLVKPLRLFSEGKHPDYLEPSPCHKALLRNAKAVFGLEDSALDSCFICAQCGEWYHLGARPATEAELAEGSKRLRLVLRHIPPEEVTE